MLLGTYYVSNRLQCSPIRRAGQVDRPRGGQSVPYPQPSMVGGQVPDPIKEFRLQLGVFSFGRLAPFCSSPGWSRDLTAELRDLAWTVALLFQLTPLLPSVNTRPSSWEPS